MTENDPLRRKYIEAALNRTRNEMDPDPAKVLAEAIDWFTICPVCGKRREGTIEDLKRECDHGNG